MGEKSEAVEAMGLQDKVGSALGKFLPWVRTAVLLVSVAAAVPTATTLYHSWVHGIPFNQVSHRLAQYELWMKNIECNITYRALLTADGSRVDAGACPKTGDVAIKVTTATGQATYEWIAFERLKKPSAASLLLDVLVPSAHAQGAPVAGPASADGQQPATTARPHSPLQLAQAGMEVICQAKRGDKIVRIIKEGNKCFRETMSPLRGNVERREEVACNTGC